MTTTINRAQILRNTRETLEHTLRFFHTMNENLRNFVGMAETRPVTPQNVEEITKICTDFHREQEIRITELNNIWTDFTKATAKPLPAHITDMFNPTAMIRMNREVMDHTIRFFTTTNEALLNGKMPQHDQILPRNVVETINCAIQDFQKTQIEFTGMFEETFQKVLRATPLVPRTEENTLRREEPRHPTHRLTDEVFTLNRDIIENTIHFVLNLNEHTTALLESIDHKDIERHARLITEVRDEFVRNRKTMVERFDTFIHRTAETLSTLRPEAIPTLDTTPLFDHQEVLQINQNAITSVVKLFTTITETLLQEKRPEHMEIIIRATDEFRKLHHVLATRIETIWTEACKRLMAHTDLRRTVVNHAEPTIKHHEAGHDKTTTPRTEKHTEPRAKRPDTKH